jgi:flagellar biosynthetic protein FliP
VRFGPKTLLVAVSAGGCHTLAELADPQATACIASACRGVHPPIRPAAATSRVLRAVGQACLLVAVSWGPARVAWPQPASAPGLRQVEAASFTATAPAEAPARSGPPARLDPVAAGQDAPSGGSEERAAATDVGGMATLVQRFRGIGSLDTALSAAVALGVASLVPALLLMTTCFVRISIVLALVRQGLGTPQLPSNQILSALALFLSALVMWPVWTAAYREGVEPFENGRIELAVACERGSLPVRRWMSAQIEQAGNRDTMRFFLERHPAAPLRVATYDDVPVEALLPAFLVSELETAFAIGFRLLLPFLVLDVLVATLVMSTGLVMLPPTLVALPLKLLVFVAADGWSLVVKALLDGMRQTAS